eukprot:1192458-Prorocentrum_minimum.AAC.2
MTIGGALDSVHEDLSARRHYVRSPASELVATSSGHWIGRGERSGERSNGRRGALAHILPDNWTERQAGGVGAGATKGASPKMLTAAGSRSVPTS